MNPATILQTAAYIPIIGLRPFATAFFVALLATLRPYISVEADSWFIQVIPVVPSWFTHIFTLIVLGILGTIEVAMAFSRDFRIEVESTYNFVRIAIGFVLTLSLLDPETEMLLAPMAHPEISTLQLVWSSFMSGVTWLIATIRSGFYRMLGEVDDGDELGLQGSLTWMETAAVPVGVILATFVPIIALILFGLTILGLWLTQYYFDRREMAQQVPCANCNQLIHPAAAICHYCGHQRAQPKQIGAFGQVKEAVAHNPADHRLNLLARKRCPVCASRLEAKLVQQTCTTCQTVTFSNAEALQAYVQALQPKLYRTIGICLALSFIPILGLVPGIIYYRLSLIASLRRYLPRRTGCTTRWIVRLLNLGLIVLQPIPGLGALTLPLMCVSNFYIYRGALLGEGLKKTSS